MGVNIHAVEFLLHAKSLGVDLGSTLTIGRQNLFLRKRGKWPWSKFRNLDEDIQKLMRESVEPHGFADTLFKNIGATKLEAIDNSSYEGADYVHDMNDSIPQKMHQQFDTVFDGGSLEHIFNVSVAIGNMMQMVKVGGHFLTFSVGDSFCGHGFYQFSPEFFFRAFSEENGFKCKLVGLMDKSELPQITLIADPLTTGKRIEFSMKAPNYIVAVAQRMSDVKPFRKWPQQSLYQTAWDEGVGPPMPEVLSKKVIEKY